MIIAEPDDILVKVLVSTAAGAISELSNAFRRQSGEVFRYCAYWHTWNRVLSKTHQPFSVVEVNLTPINSVHPSADWDKDVRGIRIRRHYTPVSSRDILVPDLPKKVIESMLRNLPIPVVYKLLTGDFLPLIDWEKYQKVCNGGANLADIMKEA